MTNGENNAIQILVADELGIYTTCVGEAQKYLTSGKIQPTFIRSFSEQASVCVRMISKNKCSSKAHKVAEKYINALNN